MTHTVLYVYGLVKDGFDASTLPAGLDDAPVALHASGEFRVLLSRLPDEAYGAAAIETSSGDVSWLSARAMAHDRVLTWAQEHGGVIPFPMFSMFSGDAALATSLTARAPELRRAFQLVSGADEFGVRVHRRESAMLAVIHQLDAALGELRAEADAASPGQRYLLERKIAEQGKTAMRAASQRMASSIFGTLKGLSRQAVTRPLAPVAGGDADATLVLNGAFLVDRSRVDAFRAAVAESIRAHEPHGLSFDFTGPWPPYNFAGGASTHEDRP